MIIPIGVHIPRAEDHAHGAWVNAAVAREARDVQVPRACAWVSTFPGNFFEENTQPFWHIDDKEFKGALMAEPGGSIGAIEQSFGTLAYRISRNGEGRGEVCAVQFEVMADAYVGRGEQCTAFDAPLAKYETAFGQMKQAQTRFLEKMSGLMASSGKPDGSGSQGDCSYSESAYGFSLAMNYSYRFLGNKTACEKAAKIYQELKTAKTSFEASLAEIRFEFQLGTAMFENLGQFGELTYDAYIKDRQQLLQFSSKATAADVEEAVDYLLRKQRKDPAREDLRVRCAVLEQQLATVIAFSKVPPEVAETHKKVALQAVKDDPALNDAPTLVRMLTYFRLVVTASSPKK